jgi:hypothetical protein
MEVGIKNSLNLLRKALGNVYKYLYIFEYTQTILHVTACCNKTLFIKIQRIEALKQYLKLQECKRMQI